MKIPLYVRWFLVDSQDMKRLGQVRWESPFLPYGLFREGEHIALEDHDSDSSATAGI